MFFEKTNKVFDFLTTENFDLNFDIEIFALSISAQDFRPISFCFGVLLGIEIPRLDSSTLRIIL